MKAIPPKTRSPRALATTWLVAAVVFLAFEVVARVRPMPVWEREEEQLLVYQRAKINAMEPGSIVLLGDSSLGNDVDARVLSEELGLPAANLALVASFTTFGDAYLLQRVFAKEKAPKAIVLFHTPDLWPRPFAEDFYALVQRGTGTVSLETVARELARTSALARQSKAWQLQAFAKLRGLGWNREKLDEELAKAGAARATLAERDYIPPADKHPSWIAREPELAAGRGVTDPFVLGGAFRVDPHVATWLDRVLDLAAEHGVPVYVAICPVWRSKCFSGANPGFLAELRAWLDQRSENGARFRLLWTPTLAVRGEHVGDKAEHLAPAAKPAFTRWMAARLRESVLEGRASSIPDVPYWDPFADAATSPP